MKLEKYEKNVEWISILWYFVFSLMTFILSLKGEPYFYVIVIYAIGANYKEKIYFLINFIAVLTVFLFNKNFDYMILIVSAIFFLFKVVANFFIYKNSTKRMFPYVSTSLVVFSIYFMKNIALVNFSELLLSFSFAFLCFYVFHKILDNYQYSKNVIDSKDRIIIYTLMPFLFEGVTLFYLFFIRVIHLLLIKCAKFSEALASLILMCFFFAYFLNISQITILLFVLPFLFSFMVSHDHPLITYTIFYILSNIFLLESFYIQAEFYQGLISIIFMFMIPESFYVSLSNLLQKDEEINKTKNQENTEKVLDYLSLVLDSRLENIKSPIESIYEELKKDLCENCDRKNICKLNQIIKDGIKDKYEKEQRKKILDECLYPYKLFKRTITFNEIYKKEEKKLIENRRSQELYKKELENLYYPLKGEEKEITCEEVIKELEKEELEVIDVKKYNDTLIVELNKYRFDDEETILTIICDLFKTSFIFVNKKYSFSLGGYILEFSKKKRYVPRIASYSSSYLENICGDKIHFDEDRNKFRLLLSDGMGHNQKSSSLSEYLLDSIIKYSKIDRSLLRQIETANRLIYQKSSIEMYATLDYFLLDLVTLKFTLFKAGSFPTYIFHQGKLKESKKNFTPLGILEKIEPFAFRDFLQEGDVLVFLSDGFGEDVKDIVEDVILKNYEKAVEEITSSLKKDLLKQKEVDDDKTLVVIKIEKTA